MSKHTSKHNSKRQPQIHTIPKKEKEKEKTKLSTSQELHKIVQEFENEIIFKSQLTNQSNNQKSEGKLNKYKGL